MKYHDLELGQRLVHVFGHKQARDSQAEAERDDYAAEAAKDRALHYDVGEGLLEIGIGLVLSSMYFISRKTMFPVI
jgi:hypothetical protein